MHKQHGRIQRGWVVAGAKSEVAIYVSLEILVPYPLEKQFGNKDVIV